MLKFSASKRLIFKDFFPKEIRSVELLMLLSHIFDKNFKSHVRRSLKMNHNFTIDKHINLCNFGFLFYELQNLMQLFRYY